MNAGCSMHTNDLLIARKKQVKSAMAEEAHMHRAQSDPLGASLKWSRAARMNARSTIAGTLDKILGSAKPPRANPHVHGVQPNVVVGPVIGKVTENSARILIEINRDAFVTAVLDAVAPEPEECNDKSAVLRKEHSWRVTAFMRRGGSLSKHAEKFNEKKNNLLLIEEEEEEQSRFEVEMELKAGRPAVFHFTNLKPNTRYKMDFKGCHYSLSGSLRTFSRERPECVNIGVISCNNIHITQQAIPIHSDLWAHLAKTIEARKVDYLVHLGDQIYADVDPKYPELGGEQSNRFRVAKRMLKGLLPNEWEQHKEKICEIYREAYRETWQHLPTAKCLANCPNLMILDDHEIRDNWGDIPEDWDLKNVDFFVARCAWIVYLEYQRQLHEDVDFSSLQNIRKEHHFHLVGGVGLMFLDIRGSRTFHRIDGDHNPYLGAAQWEDIASSLASGGFFDKTRALVVCSPAPLVFLEPLITNVAAKRVSRLEDFKGHWSAQLHIQEQIQMIDSLVQWKAAQAGREVLILGGDVHCGGHSDVLKDNQVVFQQLTSSAIANAPLPKSAYYFMRFVGGLGGTIRPGYSFRHYHWTRSRNYGLIQVKNPRLENKGSVEITAQLVKGKFMRGIRYGAKVSNSKTESKQRVHVCC